MEKYIYITHLLIICSIRTLQLPRFSKLECSTFWNVHTHAFPEKEFCWHSLCQLYMIVTGPQYGFQRRYFLKKILKWSSRKSLDREYQSVWNCNHKETILGDKFWGQERSLITSLWCHWWPNPNWTLQCQNSCSSSTRPFVLFRKMGACRVWGDGGGVSGWGEGQEQGSGSWQHQHAPGSYPLKVWSISFKGFYIGHYHH